jgi:hypothetical protein
LFFERTAQREHAQIVLCVRLAALASAAATFAYSVVATVVLLLNCVFHGYQVYQLLNGQVFVMGSREAAAANASFMAGPVVDVIERSRARDHPAMPKLEDTGNASRIGRGVIGRGTFVRAQEVEDDDAAAGVGPDKASAARSASAAGSAGDV